MEYELIRSNRKSVSITVTADSRVVVRAPMKTADKVITDFINLKYHWIEKKLQEVKLRQAEHKEIEYKEGEEFLFMGDKYSLKYSDSEKKIAIKEGLLVLPMKYKKNPQKYIKDFYFSESKRIFEEITEYYSGLTGIKYSSVGVTNAKTKWGSCNSNGKINYSFRLIMAPIKAIDYIVVHELSHIGCFNHSKKFWARVESVLSDYKETRKWLKENARILSIL